MRYFKGFQKKGKDDRVRWALFASFDIPCNDGLYLRRLRIVQTPLFGVYLHEMHAPDSDRDFHDHPFNFVSLVLKGGYRELLQDSRTDPHAAQGVRTVEYGRWSVHRMRTTQGHRIIALKDNPTYTLVLVGRRLQNWGFWTRAGWIQWDKYHEITGGERAV